jgi:hypothetical protein
MASDVYFTTNPNDFSQLEGLYISERQPPGFISGVDLSAVGILGVTVRGPTAITEITSVARFVEVFGGRDYGAGGTLINKIWKDLINKPFGKLYVKRVTDTTSAVAGAVTFPTSAATSCITVTATSVGAWSLAANSGPTVAIATATDGNTSHFNMVVSYLGSQTTYQNIDASGTATADDIAEIVGDDIANVVVVTIANNGVPAIASATALTGGADGTLAASHFTAALTALANAEGPRIIFCADAPTTPATYNAQVVTEAALVSDRVFVTWSGTHGQTAAVEAASAAGQITTRSDRIIWTYNSPYTLDPETGTQIQCSPAAWMASVLCQNDVDIHPGSIQTTKQTAGIRKLTNTSLPRADLITLRNAGVCTLESIPEGFVFRSGVTTNLTSGLTEITRRRSADFLQLSAANRLRTYVKRKNTITNRANMAAELTAFSQQLLEDERIVEAFAIDQQSVNTTAQRAQGIEKILWRVKLIGHILHLVLETEIGSGVVIEAA